MPLQWADCFPAVTECPTPEIPRLFDRAIKMATDLGVSIASWLHPEEDGFPEGWSNSLRPTLIVDWDSRTIYIDSKNRQYHEWEIGDTHFPADYIVLWCFIHEIAHCAAVDTFMDDVSDDSIMLGFEMIFAAQIGFDLSTWRWACRNYVFPYRNKHLPKRIQHGNPLLMNSLTDTEFRSFAKNFYKAEKRHGRIGKCGRLLPMADIYAASTREYTEYCRKSWD